MPSLFCTLNLAAGYMAKGLKSLYRDYRPTPVFIQLYMKFYQGLSQQQKHIGRGDKPFQPRFTAKLANMYCISTKICVAYSLKTC